MGDLQHQGNLYSVKYRLLKDSTEFRRHIKLQRLFTTFPDRIPGIGLLLLRTTIAGSVFFLIGILFSARVELTYRIWIISGALLICAAATLVGVLTPIVSLITLIGGVLFLILAPTQILTAPIIYLIILSAVIVLLGPGAYSIDARLFGRREIFIRQNNSNA